MTLLEKLNFIIDNYNKKTGKRIFRAEDLPWRGEPLSLNETDKEYTGFLLQIDVIIDRASELECKTYRGYINNCKRWMLEHNYKERWVEFFNKRLKFIRD